MQELLWKVITNLDRYILIEQSIDNIYALQGMNYVYHPNRAVILRISVT